MSSRRRRSDTELAVRGRAAHAGIEPEKGVSAIRVLSEILSAIPNGRIDSETTCNAGIIAGEGDEYRCR